MCSFSIGDSQQPSQLTVAFFEGRACRRTSELLSVHGRCRGPAGSTGCTVASLRTLTTLAATCMTAAGLTTTWIILRRDTRKWSDDYWTRTRTRTDMTCRCGSVVHLQPSSTGGSHLAHADIKKLRDHELSMIPWYTSGRRHPRSYSDIRRSLHGCSLSTIVRFRWNSLPLYVTSPSSNSPTLGNADCFFTKPRFKAYLFFPDHFLHVLGFQFCTPCII